ncbi:MAG: PAS domain S-box protein [Prolixibacteraceae bacterium]|nr:PAS domain S-box protein [Prolixibacteraceae bacterium]
MLNDLIQNTSLLIALSVLYGLLTRICKSDSLSCKIIGGILFGTIAIAAMKMSIHFNTGVIYDGRSIVLTLSGLFGGGITGIVSVLIAGAYRIYLGGAGIWAGTATIITTALVGFAFRILHQNKPELLKIHTLWGMGIITHLVMLFCQLLLPWPTGLQVVEKIWIPVMLVLPVGTLLMGLLLATDKKRFLAEKEIRESETLYRTTLHSIGDAVITTDRLGKIKFMNPLAEQLTGWKETDAIGCPIEQVFSIINEDSRLKVDCPVPRILQEGIIVGLANHTLLISKGGVEIPIADSGAPIRDDDRNVIGVVLVFRDQTAERIMLRQMHESRERFRRAVENIPDVVVIYDRNLKIQYVNDAMAQISQRPASDFIGFTDSEIWGLEVIKDYLPALKDTLRTGEARKFKLLIPIPNIGERHLNFTCTPLTDENGFVWEIMTIANDFTKSKLAEDELIERERLFHTLADNSPVGIFRTRPDGYTTYVNPKWMELSGLSFEESLGDGWLKAVLPEDLEQLHRGWDSATKNFTGSVAEYRFLRSDGRIVWVTGAAVPELTSKGQLIGYIGTLTDISERKIAERALRQSEENYRRSMDESPLGMRIVSSDGKTLYVNQALLSMYGFTSLEDYINTPIEKRYTAESLKQHLQRRSRRKNGEPVEQEYEIDIIRPDTEIRHIHIIRKMIDWDGTSQIQIIYQDFTDRNNAQQALKKSEKSLKESQEIAQMGDWEFDLVKNESIWSENCYRLFGLKPFEIVPNYEDFRSRIHPDDLYLLDRGYTRIMSCKSAIDMKVRIVLSDGQVKWILNKIIPEFENGELIKLRGVNLDITESRHTLEALQRSEKGYKNLFENHTAVKLLIDPQTGDIADANYAAESFYGHSRKQLRKMNIRQIVLLSEDEFNKELNIAQNSKNKQTEYCHQLADGSVRNVEVFTSKIEFKDEVYLHSIIHDITEKKKAEDLLQLLSRSTDQSPVSIVITDPQGIVQYVNPKFTETTGYSTEEAIGKKPGIVKSGEHSKEFYDNLWETIRSGKEWRGEFHNRKKNGELYWESAVISAIIDKKGNITHFVEAKEDVTEKKKIIADLKISKEKAEESDRLKSAFLANMSHEIRTPLNAILGFSGMLTEDYELSQDVKEEYSSIINRNADNLLHIIDDILDISKLETGQVKIVKKRFELSQTLNELYTQYQSKISEIGKESITLNLSIPELSISVNTDKVRLNQILSNLLNNSIKFTHHGKIEFGVMEVTKQTITFFVSDTGIGIEKDIQSTIFERFRQANDSMTRLYGGAGLGLSIVKNLIELMGGEIQIESEIGKGTTFKFWLPLD